MPGEAGLASMHPCATCATMQRTCCQRADVVVTQGDIDRLAHFTGRTDVWERRRPADPSYHEADPDDPNWLTYVTEPDGSRRLLRRREDGDCIFLGREGCTLPTEVRPLVCRLYPFAFTERGLTGEAADYCPSSRLAPPGVTMLTVLGMSPDDGERWRSQLYRELRDGALRRGTAPRAGEQRP